jgi:peptide/nickel transport system ATP-binding protein
MASPLLSIRDLRVEFLSARGAVVGLDGVSLDVGAGEMVGIAGESGSGKSTLAQAILRILPPPAVIRGGSVRFLDREILTMPPSELRALRWKEISIVLQSSLDALNPVLTIGAQLVDTLTTHTPTMHRADARARAGELLSRVGISTSRLDSYPHQLSGGMRQRVGIALALSLGPKLLILDEPTTALDVIVEQEILALLSELRRTLGFSVLFITHDLGRMLQLCDRVAILYAARISEVGPAAALSRAALHPYTAGLMAAFPSLHSRRRHASIPGSPVSLGAPPSGCRFHPRCERADERCRVEAPPLVQISSAHALACHHPLTEKAAAE